MLDSPLCDGLTELPSAAIERGRLREMSLAQSGADDDFELSAIMRHLSYGLAYTTGSAVGNVPPSEEECLDAFLVTNGAGLTAGARAWTKHHHRSGNTADSVSGSWWGTPKGPVATINAGARELFRKVAERATWRNLHWLPHEVLVYEVRVREGYGMRWSQDRSAGCDGRPWIYRGFVEPMMDNGHELGWKH